MKSRGSGENRKVKSALWRMNESVGTTECKGKEGKNEADVLAAAGLAAEQD